MPLVPRPHPPALPHGPLDEVLPGLHFVTGTMAMGGGVRFSRAMTVVVEGDRLVLVNTVRLDDAGLAALDKLGRVTDVIRIAGNHGMDDPFYKERYGAKLWAVKGQRYTAGFDTNAANVYAEPDVEMDTSTPLPIAGAKLHIIASSPPEALLLLERSRGTVIAGDCLQNWAAPDAYFSFTGKLMTRFMGFLKPYNVGPGWFKQCKPPKAEVRAVLGLPFQNVLPSHGTPVLGEAVSRYRPIVEALTA